jgi:CheY-like chemotaxis protein
LSSRLKRMVEVLVGVALAAALVALAPGVAEAQDAASTKDDPSVPSAAQNPTSLVVVVRPSDSLWSISHRLLGPGATPRRITEGVEQIYALNRNRIGPDPNLISVGQKLLVPPARSERSTGRSTRATPSRKTTEAVEAGPRGRAAKSTTDMAPRTAVDNGGEAPEPVTLPDAAGAPVPAIRSLASNDPPPSPVTSFLRTVRSAVASMASAVSGSFAEAFAQTRSDGRRLLGLGIVLLTLVASALMAWKLSMRRTTRWDAEASGMPTGYYGSAAYRIAPFAYHPGAAAANGRARTLNAKAVPRNGLAHGVHNPEVRRAAGATSDESANPLLSKKDADEHVRPLMKRFLLVEDHALFREALALVLERHTGFDSVRAASLAEASRVLDNPPGTIGMAIVDVELPEGGGIELIAKLRETEPNIPVVAFTTARDPNRHAQALRAGADEVFSTWEPIEELVRTARRLGGDAPE